MKNRLALSINTYSYKLVSYLYIKYKIKTFNTVVWNIEGDKDKNGNITLYPTATYIFEDGFEVPNNYKFPASIKIEGNPNNIILKEKENSRKKEENYVTVTYDGIPVTGTFSNNIINYTIYSYLYHDFYKD